MSRSSGLLPPQFPNCEPHAAFLSLMPLADSRGSRRGAAVTRGLPCFPEAEHPLRSHVHSETLQGEGQEPEIPWSWHFEDFPFLEHGKDVMPFCGCPVIPEFPQPAAYPAGNEQCVEPASPSGGEVC